MTGRTITSVLIIAAIVLGAGTAMAAPSKDRAAAESALQYYKTTVPPEQFNFKDTSDINAAAVGDGLPFWRLRADWLAEGRGSLADAMVDTGDVVFLVESKGRIANRMTMHREGTTLVRNSFGGLGSGLSQGLTTLPAEARADVRIAALGTVEFLYVGLPGQELLVLAQDREVGGFQPYRVYPAGQAIPKLQAMAQAMLNGSGEGGIGGGNTPNPSVPWGAMGILAVLAVLVGVLIFTRRKGSEVR
ncbi:MAG TPA: hypothetical protein VNT01_15140 [Symbiobacteriaceae bacterium]|nr:hypothetical protein [Symbiobacteriaceae bacterium]